MAATRKRSSATIKAAKVAAQLDTLREFKPTGPPSAAPDRDDALREEMRAMRRELDAVRAELDALRTLVVHGRVSGAYRGESES